MYLAPDLFETELQLENTFINDWLSDKDKKFVQQMECANEHSLLLIREKDYLSLNRSCKQIGS